MGSRGSSLYTRAWNRDIVVGMADIAAKRQDWRRVTPALRLAEDTKAAFAALGVEVKKIVAALPQSKGGLT